MLTIPLFFANIIVSWPFNIVILLYLMYELYVKIDAEKKVFNKQSL